MKRSVVKKLLVLGCCGILLTGCGGASVNEDDFQRLQNGIEKNQTIESAHLEANIFAEVEAESEKARVKFNAIGDFKAKDKPEASMTMDISANGIKLADQMHLYYTNDTLYLDFMENKLKLPIASLLENALEKGPLLERDQSTEIEQIDNIKSLEVVEESDGTHFTLTYKDTWVQESIKKAMADVEATYDEKQADMVKSILTDLFQSLSITYVVDQDGYASTIGGTGEINYTPEANITDPIRMKFEMNIKMSEINKVESITFPDLSEYPIFEGDMDALNDDFANSDLSL